jgi:hypothetical protein
VGAVGVCPGVLGRGLGLVCRRLLGAAQYQVLRRQVVGLGSRRVPLANLGARGYPPGTFDSKEARC